MKLKLTILGLFMCTCLMAQQALIDQTFFLGRDYYVLRSGQAKMVIQTDQSTMGPAFRFMLFDADNTKQTEKKFRAFNYTHQAGFDASALQVVMGEHPFTALGTQLDHNWVVTDGIPGVQAQWWAGGIKVTEVITPETETGIFRRHVRLESVDLQGVDSVSIRLNTPSAPLLIRDNAMMWKNHQIGLTMLFPQDIALRENGQFETLPRAIAPGETLSFDTYMIVDIPLQSTEKMVARAASLPQTIAQERAVITKKWAQSNTISSPDTLVNRMHNLARYMLPGYVSLNGRMDAGIFEYGGQWVRDGSNTTIGMIHIGEFERARAMLDHMLKNMINDEGTTMIYGNFEDPDREQLDQMGEFMHVMKAYLDWSGDTTLLTENKAKLIAMIQRPLRPYFRDETGMVHNRREFWERIFDDAYELVYQTMVISGLRDGADMTHYLGAEKLAPVWRAEADKIQDAMLNHPTKKLVEEGHLVKRRNLTGEVVQTVKFNHRIFAGAPAGTEATINVSPDAGMALPICLGVIDPKSELSINTLNELETLWNRRWSFGGYDRYNTSSQIDQPGPWTFATTFIMRAQHEAGLLHRSRRALDWLSKNGGGRTGAWLEEIPIINNSECAAGILPWTSGEVAYFMVHHMLGVKFNAQTMTIKPALYQESVPLKADLRYKGGRFTLEIDGTGATQYALINNVKVKPDAQGRIVVPVEFAGGTICLVTKK